MGNVMNTNLQKISQLHIQPVTRREEAAQEKLQRIIEEACKLFAEKGFHGTAVPEVASAAGVAAGTIYRYFDNKEDLVNGVFVYSKKKLQGYIQRDTDISANCNLEEHFALLWDNLCCFARENPTEFYFLELQEHTKYLTRESRKLEREVLAPIKLFAIYGKRRGDIKPVPTMALIAMVWGAFVGLFKADAHGYTHLTQDTISEAGRICWQMVSARSTTG